MQLSPSRTQIAKNYTRSAPQMYQLVFGILILVVGFEWHCEFLMRNCGCLFNYSGKGEHLHGPRSNFCAACDRWMMLVIVIASVRRFFLGFCRKLRLGYIGSFRDR
eukprot:SAG31_NODE_371_length_16628_cov_3.741943_7_plen_106_part_00